MVVGEREIAGQVKRALETAHADGVTSSTLELLFQTASRTSKKVSTHTTLGGAGRSVVALGLDLAAAELPPWPQVRAVLIGTGSYAGASLAALRALGCDDVRVYSQSGRAEEFAAARGVEAVTDLVAALEDADLVVSCSGARGRALAADAARPGAERREQAIEHVLDAAAVVRARERAAVRAGEEPVARPTVVLDLALHRDVDPRVADVEGVLLYDLATLAAHSPSIASELVTQARAIVDEATRAFEETRLGRAADTAVVALLADAERRVALECGRRRRAARGGRRPGGAGRGRRDRARRAAPRARRPAPRDRRGPRGGRRRGAGRGARGRRGRPGARPRGRRRALNLRPLDGPAASGIRLTAQSYPGEGGRRTPVVDQEHRRPATSGPGGA